MTIKYVRKTGYQHRVYGMVKETPIAYKPLIFIALLFVNKWFYVKNTHVASDGSFDGKIFRYRVHRSRPDRAEWPPICPLGWYMLLNSMLNLRNRLIIRSFRKKQNLERLR